LLNLICDLLKPICSLQSSFCKLKVTNIKHSTKLFGRNFAKKLNHLATKLCIIFFHKLPLTPAKQAQSFFDFRRIFLNHV
ncbi:MAG: hypothetical protein LBF22_08955, partial [Deltaproteobacteria bacterium]|nr:hypothetical protein [Deltaproteobacteria bacterium]